MAVEVSFEGVEDVKRGFDEWQKSYWGQLKEEFIARFEAAANFAKANAPTPAIKESIKTEVTGGNTEKWQPFELKMTVDDPSIITAEFGREKLIKEGQNVATPEHNPPSRKAPLSGYITTTFSSVEAAKGGRFMAATQAIFFEDIEWEFDVFDKILIE